MVILSSHKQVLESWLRTQVDGLFDRSGAGDLRFSPDSRPMAAFASNLPSPTSAGYEDAVIEFVQQAQTSAVGKGLGGKHFFSEEVADAEGACQDLYFWDNDTGNDEGAASPMGRRFRAHTVLSLSFVSGTVRWTADQTSSSSNARSGLRQWFDEAVVDLAARSGADDQACEGGLQKTYAQLAASAKPGGLQLPVEVEDEQIGWVLAGVCLSKLSGGIGLYSFPIGVPIGSGRAWMVLADVQQDVPVPERAVEFIQQQQQQAAEQKQAAEAAGT